MAGTEESTLVLGEPNIEEKVCVVLKKTTNSHFQY